MILLQADSDGILNIVIYALVIVGGLVVKAYQEYEKKKKQQSYIPPIEEKPFPDFPEIFYDEPFEEGIPAFEESPKEEYKPVEIKKPELESAKSGLFLPEDNYDKEMLAAFANEGVSAFSYEDSNVRYVEDLGKEIGGIEENTDEVERFDLREAIVYSEILRAKYIQIA